MTDFDYTDESFIEEEPEKRSFSIDRLDIFSILLLIAAACLGAYFLLVFVNPYTALNPLHPNTPVPPVILPSPTNTPLELNELWTMTPTIQPTITPTSRSTFTPIPTETPLILYTETFTPEPPAATSTPKMPFDATIQSIDSKIIHPDTNCDWLGVGGTITDANNSHIQGIVVRIGGTLVGKSISRILPSEYMISGITPIYGRSGFEFVIGEVPVPSNDTLWIRLFDQAGLPLSDEIHFSTTADCEKNLVLIRFRKVR